MAGSCSSRKVEEAQTVSKEEAGKAMVTGTEKKLNDHVMIPSSDERSPRSLHS